MSRDQPHRFRRWVRRPFAAAIVLAGIALIWTWLFRDSQRQDKWVATAVIAMALYALFLVWLLLGSGWRAPVRWAVLAGSIGVVLFCRVCLRISGVTGDLVPIVSWRWKTARELTVASGQPPPTATAALTNSYPQFLGPNRDGIVAGPRLARDWKQKPPEELWRHAVGAAWSGFAIAGHVALTQEQRGEDELVVCYDVLSGREVWTHRDRSRYATTIAGEGPRATPTIDGSRAYALGGAGEFNCLDLATGRVLWHTNTLAAHGARLPEWGVAASPLVTGRAVLVTAGGRNSSLVAYDKETGAVLWTGGSDDVHWSSPTRAIFEDVPQIVVFSQNVSAYDEGTGKLLWHYPWPNTYPHVSVPLVLADNRLLVSQGYGTGSELLQIWRDDGRWQAKRIWKSIRLKSKFANLIYLEGHVYGLDDGALVCIELNSGELKWKGERYGHGQMILAGKLLLLMAESGDIVLLEPNPAEPRELSRRKIFDAKTWNPPALAGDLLLVRNDREAACLRLPLER